MHAVQDIAPGAMVGILAAYKLLQEASDAIPGNLMDLLLGNVGTLVLSLIIGYWLYRANQQQRQRLEAIQEAQVNDLRAQIARLEGERERLMLELLEEHPRPARRRAS